VVDHRGERLVPLEVGHPDIAHPVIDEHLVDALRVRLIVTPPS
jgi:hypothetical protein